MGQQVHGPFATAECLLALGLSFQSLQARSGQVIDGKLVQILPATRAGHLLDDNCEYASQNRNDYQNEH
ncbi:hypothetical protein [Neorhizobium sp. T25_27]|uniref:hypothetical protein n=1 Tax=Neorhizobium sp. T25_27 TaxID=2093831 RepID=UPI000CF8EC1D|nr:hypothetical protein [Neorhizobium sp. T25_27]